jgi:hypothetical protein
MAASVKTRASYDEDLYARSLEQAALLRRAGPKAWTGYTWRRRSSGCGTRHEVKNRLQIILLNLLKWQAQPARCGASWRMSLRMQRGHVLDLLRESPSLARIDAGGLCGPDQKCDRRDWPAAGLAPTDRPYTRDDVLAGGYLADAAI